MSLTVWGRISSINVRKVVLCAQLLDLAFERIDAGLSHGIVQTDDYHALNPNRLVPTLQDGNFTLWESNVIVRYLCAGHANGTLYPQELRERFEAERWMDWQQTTLNRASGPAFVQWIRTAPELRNQQLIDQSVAATEPLLAMIEAQLARHGFIAGNRLTMADIPMACEIHRWWGLPQPRAKWPQIERWYSGILALPAARGVLDIPLA